MKLNKHIHTTIETNNVFLLYVCWLLMLPTLPAKKVVLVQKCQNEIKNSLTQCKQRMCIWDGKECFVRLPKICRYWSGFLHIHFLWSLNCAWLGQTFIISQSEIPLKQIKRNIQIEMQYLCYEVFLFSSQVWPFHFL